MDEAHTAGRDRDAQHGPAGFGSTSGLRTPKADEAWKPQARARTPIASAVYMRQTESS